MDAVTMDRPADAVTDEEVRQALLLGLPNRWWPLLPSRFVERGGSPVAINRLGESLVLWRDSEGAVHVQTDRCPHRAVPLSRGHNDGDRLSCAYHGVQIGPDGTVLRVPGQPGCPLEGKQAVRTFPSMEVADAVFAWFGDPLNLEPAPFVPPPQLAGDAYSQMLCYVDWETAWLYPWDNALDPMHGTFLHAVSHSMSQGATAAEFVTRTTPTGFFFEKKGQRDVNFDWVEFVDDGALYARLEVPYQPSAGPGGNFGIIAMMTPVDETHTAGFFWRVRRVSGWQRDTWRFLYKIKLEPLHWQVLEQDRAMLEGCKPGLDEFETLYQHDAGLIRLRRYLKQEMRQQLTALRAVGATVSGRFRQ